MITFLRKIRKRLITKGQFSSYLLYAIGEILLVMVGILLALQVNNWNENRKNKNKEQQILQQLHFEFLENKAQLERVVQGHQESLGACERVAALFPIDPLAINLDTLTSYFLSPDTSGGVIAWWTFNPQNMVMKGLSDNASLDIISNEKLKGNLMQWESTLSDYAEEEQRAMIYVAESIMPYLEDHVAWSEPTNIFKNKALDLSFLASPKFENIILTRIFHLRTILFPPNSDVELELDKLRRVIDEIILLTETNDN